MRDKKVLKYCEKTKIHLVEFPTNGVVRRLKHRDDWNTIWKERMGQDIFSAVQIQNPITVPKKLCDISKKTKQKYKDYFSKVGNGLKPFQEINQNKDVGNAGIHSKIQQDEIGRL